ncbi:NRT2.5, partial [Symbiodinium sp. KB8]
MCIALVATGAMLYGTFSRSLEIVSLLDGWPTWVQASFQNDETASATVATGNGGCAKATVQNRPQLESETSLEAKVASAGEQSPKQGMCFQLQLRRATVHGAVHGAVYADAESFEGHVSKHTTANFTNVGDTLRHDAWLGVRVGEAANPGPVGPGDAISALLAGLQHAMVFELASQFFGQHGGMPFGPSAVTAPVQDGKGQARGKGPNATHDTSSPSQRKGQAQGKDAGDLNFSKVVTDAETLEKGLDSGEPVLAFAEDEAQLQEFSGLMTFQLSAAACLDSYA